jgi:hypothetical protein
MSKSNLGRAIKGFVKRGPYTLESVESLVRIRFFHEDEKTRLGGVLEEVLGKFSLIEFQKLAACHAQALKHSKEYRTWRQAMGEFSVLAVRHDTPDELLEAMSRCEAENFTEKVIERLNPYTTDPKVLEPIAVSGSDVEQTLERYDASKLEPEERLKILLALREQLRSDNEMLEAALYRVARDNSPNRK